MKLYKDLKEVWAAIHDENHPVMTPAKVQAYGLLVLTQEIRNFLRAAEKEKENAVIPKP